MNVLVALVLSSTLAVGSVEAPPAPTPTPTPPSAPESTPPATGATEVPDPTIPPPTSSAGTPKRVTGLPGQGTPVAQPKPVAPTPIAPKPVEPVGPKPIVGGDNTPTKIVPDDEGGDDPRPRRKPRRDRGAKVDTDGGSDTGACLAPQARCRTFVIAGASVSAGGIAAGIGGAILLTRRPTPLLEDPTRIETFRPPGIALVAIGGALFVAGIAVLAAGVASHRRDQSMRRSAWWRPVIQVGALRL